MRQWGDYQGSPAYPRQPYGQPYPLARSRPPQRYEPAAHRQRVGYCLGGLVLLITIGLSIAVNGAPGVRSTCGSACAAPADRAPAGGTPTGARPAGP
jgi:hypothetical protein